ncbi:MAG: SDR family oxidoreductase, partial [Actinomycetota bacterium]
CDLIVASRGAEFWLPEVNLGIVPDAGGMLRLVRRLPRAPAKELLLTGRRMGAEEAARWGLVNEVVEPEGLMNAARELAERIDAAAPLAIRGEGRRGRHRGAPGRGRVRDAPPREHPRLRSGAGLRGRAGGPPGVRREAAPRLARSVSPSLSPDANDGRVALVTGGGTGIGRATALELARTGARVAICGRRPEPLEAVRGELQAAGVECLAVPCDVREPAQVAALLDSVLQRFGAIDVLVNNAGGQFVAPAEGITLDGWRAVHRLAVDAAWDLTREVATRSMIPNRRGVVIFLGFSPRRGIPGHAHASAARAALESLAASLAIEWGRYGIRAICVVLGNIDTEAFAGYGEEVLDASRRQVPLGRLGRPEDVAGVIAFLASDGGSYVTGSSVLVDGGLDAWGQGEPPPPPAPGATGR